MNYLKQHKRLIIFILASIFFLLAFDIFNEVSKRGDLSSRILPRVFRVLLLFVFSLFFFRISKGSKNKFNQIIILIYLTILLYMFFDSNLGFDTLISMSKLLYLFFSYLFFFKFYLLFYNHQTIRYLNLFVMLSVFILTFHIVGSRLNLI